MNAPLLYLKGKAGKTFNFSFFLLHGQESVSYLIAKLQLIRSQHDDVIIDGEHSFCLDFVIGKKAVAQLVLLGTHHFERNADFRPKRFYRQQQQQHKDGI